MRAFPFPHTHKLRGAPLLWLGLSLVPLACSDGASPLEPEPEVLPTAVRVDASTEWAYVQLTADGPVEVSAVGAEAPSHWDLAFFGTSVMVNGGDAGPGERMGFCVCNGAATNEAVLAMTEEMGLERFREVTTADAPQAPEAWVPDALLPAISDWWSYDRVSHSISPVADATWLLRTSGGARAKLEVVAMEGATRDHAGRVTLRYQVQATSDGEPGEIRQVVLDAAEGPDWVDLDAAEGEGAAHENWDVRLDGYALRVNGGTGGNGNVGAVRLNQPFHEVSDLWGVPQTVLVGDRFGGVFDQEPEAQWYRYNLQGRHQVWPTYHVYLIRHGSDTHKVQILGYYGPDGTSRQVTLRSAPLES